MNCFCYRPASLKKKKESFTNKSLKPKKLFPEHSALKVLPTDTMTKKTIFQTKRKCKNKVLS